MVDQDAGSLLRLQQSCEFGSGRGDPFRGAFWTDVRPIVKEWRQARKLPVEPLKTLWESGYVETISRERGARNANSVSQLLARKQELHPALQGRMRPAVSKWRPASHVMPAGLAMLKTHMAKPIVLTILDGWGYRAETSGNAIALARKPVCLDSLLRDFPTRCCAPPTTSLACLTATRATMNSYTSNSAPAASSAWT